MILAGAKLLPGIIKKREMTISHSTINDIDEIFRLYRMATEYQRVTFPQNQWPKFSRKLVQTEVREQRQFKIIIGSEIACVWAVTFHDPEIWEEKNEDPAIYIHRIATNPKFRGNDFVSLVVTWARDFAASHEKKFIRLDTCGNNKKLIEHYRKSGFNFLGIKKLKNYEGLPEHYLNADVCFFEIKIRK